jgi:hypothetical protein
MCTSPDFLEYGKKLHHFFVSIEHLTPSWSATVMYCSYLPEGRLQGCLLAFSAWAAVAGQREGFRPQPAPPLPRWSAPSFPQQWLPSLAACQKLGALVRLSSSSILLGTSGAQKWLATARLGHSELRCSWREGCCIDRLREGPQQRRPWRSCRGAQSNVVGGGRKSNCEHTVN